MTWPDCSALRALFQSIKKTIREPRDGALSSFRSE
jgi:hypothetical protein